MNTLSRTCIFALMAAVICLLAFSTANAQEEPTAPSTEYPVTLSLDDCLSYALDNNISLQRTQLGLEFSLLDRIRNESLFDPGFSLKFTVQGNDSSGATPGNSVNNQYGLSSSYTLPAAAGGSWIFSLDQSRTEGSTISGSDLTGYTLHSSQLGATYSLPLLEGYGDLVNRIGIERADLGITRSRMAISNAERSLRLSIIQAYIQAVLAQKSIEVSQVSLETAQSLVAEVQARIDVGQLAPYEILAAQAGLAERQTALINARTNLSTALDTLKSLIGLPITEEIAIDASMLQPIYFDAGPEELLARAQAERPDLADLDIRFQQAQLDLILAEDRTQPSLVWNTSVGLSGRDEGYFQSIGDMNDLAWSTGLEYRIPLNGNRASVADYTSAQFNLTQIELERLDFLRSLETDIRIAVDNLNNALLRIDVTAQGLNVQKVKMEIEQARLDLGLITARDLLQFDLDLANARLAYDSALADAINALARIEFLVNGILLQDAFALGNITGESTETTEVAQ